MVHDDQLGGVEIEHFAQFLGDLQNVISVTRPEQGFITEPNKLIFIRLDETILRKMQTGWGRPQQVGHKAEAFAVPGVQIRARAAGLEAKLEHGQRRAGIDSGFGGVEHQIEPVDVE